MEASLAFGLLSQVVHGLGGDEEVWNPPSAHGEARAAALYRTLRWLGDIARPVLVTLDDLQWADPDSLEFLGLLCRRLAGLPVALIASLRPWPPAAADLARSLVNRGDAIVEHLVPLSEEAAGDVLAERHGRPLPPEVATRAWQVSGGNPLLLGLAASLTMERSGTTEADVGAVSVNQRSLVLGRFSGLSVAGTAWARAAAVLGIGFRPEVVSEVAGLDADTSEAAAEELWRSGLARDGANGAGEFVHPLFAQLLYEDLAPLVRGRLHARAFTSFTARGMNEIAAEHAIRANLDGDEHAIEVVIDSGRRAFRAGAPATAAIRLEAAVRLSGDAAAPTLLADLGQALIEAGRIQEAESTINAALEGSLPPDRRVSALTMLSRAHYTMGDFQRAAAALESAEIAAAQRSPETLVHALCRYADVILMTAGPAAALPIVARARTFAERGSKDLQAQVRAAWGLLAFWSGDPSGLVAAESEGRHLLDATPSEVAADLRLNVSGLTILLPFAGVKMFAGHFVDAEKVFRAGIDAAERAGALSAAAALGISHGLMLMRTRVGDTLAVAERLLAIADLVPLAEPFARTMRSYALLEMAEEEQSAREWDLARATAAPYGMWYCLLWLDHVRGLGMLRHARFTEASEVYAELEERFRELGIGEPCSIPFARHAVLAHVKAGRTRDAERVVDWLDERASHLPCRWPAAAAAAGRAVVELGQDERGQADKCYRAAVEQLDGASLPVEQAEVMIDHGTALRHEGRPRESRESFRRAGELAESVGATWLARRAGQELAAAGGRRRTRRGAQELTAQEQRIARLAATGASNSDIATHLAVTVRTVRAHLEHIYAKLGIASRRELMAMGEHLEALIERGQ
jgi:DNA-binding NarL/FixJ family response regulator